MGTKEPKRICTSIRVGLCLLLEKCILHHSSHHLHVTTRVSLCSDVPDVPSAPSSPTASDGAQDYVEPAGADPDSTESDSPPEQAPPSMRTHVLSARRPLALPTRSEGCSAVVVEVHDAQTQTDVFTLTFGRGQAGQDLANISPSQFAAERYGGKDRAALDVVGQAL